MINKQRDLILEEAFEALKENNFNGAVILPTGTGKSKILIETIKHLKCKNILYLCDNTRLRDIDFPAELEKWGLKEYVDIIERQCYQTAYKWEGKKYDLCLGDEFDFALTDEYSKVFFNNKFKHKVLVSATISDEKRELAKYIAPIVYEKHIGEILDKNVLNKEQIYFVNYFLLPEENRKYLSYNEVFKRILNEDKVDNRKLSMVQINRKRFLSSLTSTKNACIKLLKDLYYENDTNKILVFCGSTDQADKITKFSYHAKNHKLDNLGKFEKGETRVCAVVDKLNRGVNLTGVNIIVFESANESKTKFVQKSGRGRRLHIDDVLRIYFLIPYFITRRGEKAPTIVNKWVVESAKDLDLTKVKIINI